MHDLFTGKSMPLGVLHKIYLANQISDGNIGRSQFFMISLFPTNPLNLATVTISVNTIARFSRDRMKRVIIDVRAGNDGNHIIQKINH